MANPPPMERPWLTQAILVLASILCGTGVWLVVQLTETQETTLNVEVRPVNVAPEVVLKVRPAEVPVKFSFPATEQSRMQPDNFFLEVDFSDLKERIGKKLEDSGDQVLSREMVQSTIQAEELNIQPVELVQAQVRWEARLRSTRGVIEPTIVGKPAPGYTFDPKKAEVDGQKELIVLLSPEKQAELEAEGRDWVPLATEPLDITGQKGIVREQVDLQLPEGVSLLPGESYRNRTLVVYIQEETITRVIEDVPLTYEFIFAREGLTAWIDPPTVDVAVTGRLSAVNALTPEKIGLGLLGISERAGVRREVAVEARILDQELRAQIMEVVVRPPAVTVAILQDGEVPPQPAQTPIATPSPTPAGTANQFVVLLDGATGEQQAAFAELIRNLPPRYSVEEQAVTREDVSAFRVTTTEPISALLDQIVSASHELPYELAYSRQTDDQLLLRVQEPETPAPPATTTPAIMPTETVPATRTADRPTS